MKKRILIFLSLMLLKLAVFSQSATLPDIKQVAFPSPQATDFQKYGDYPVSYSTGIPDISIPIYTINSSRLQVPITFAYHSAGFKPAEDNGTVGLGWSVNAGGRITRTVFGKTDELSGSPNPVRNPDTLHAMYTDNQNYISLLNNNTSNSYIDEEPDLFYFGTLTNSGKFILKNNGNGTRTPVVTKFSPVKITSNTTTYSTVAVDYFEIVDENGNTFHYGTGLTSGTGAIETSLPNTNQANLTFRSSWLLSEIISADKTDTIRFKYLGPFQGARRGSRTDNLSVKTLNSVFAQSCLSGSTCTSGGAGGYTYSNDQITWSTHSTAIISEIDYKFGKVLFNYSGPNSFNNASGHTLYQIILQNQDGINYKTYQLNQSNFGSPGNYNLSYYKMDSLQLFGTGGAYLNSYSFTYTNSTNASVPQGFEENLGIDYWGFYNGATGNTSLFPNWQISTSSGYMPAGNAIREADETNMKNYILNKIRYPTGGTTSFEFEANKISGHTIGGLRIRRITKDPVNGSLTYKSYKYGNSDGDESGFGVLQLDPYPLSFHTQLTKEYDVCNCNGISFTPNLIWDIVNYTSNFTDGSGTFETTPIFYTSVSEYDGYDVGTDNGKTVYIYTLPSNNYVSGPAGRHLAIATDWYGGEVLSKRVMKNIAGIYSVIEQDDFTYVKRQTDDIIGTKINQYLVGNVAPFTPYDYEKLFDLQYIAYNIWRYDITTGVNQLTQKIHTVSSPSGNLVTKQNFTYSNFHNYPLTTITVNSKGLNTEKDDKYPPDMTLTGIPEDARSKLLSKNIISVQLQSKSLVNNVQQTLINNYYKDFGTGFPTIESIDMQVQPFSNEKRIQFIGYDSKNNLLSQSKVSNVIKSYIYDYLLTYPIAEITNAAQTDVAYTSFEADGKGNWAFIGATELSSGTPTGKRAYNLSGGALTKSGLTASTSYIISYWRPTTVGALTITGSTLITGRTANGWTYYEHTISGITTATLSGTGLIDEVRLYPSVAQMATYTYEPVIGMTSQCDINNRIAYYTYDVFNRLQLVKDQDGKIVKKICYNYAGQIEDCSVNVSPLWTATGNLRCATSGGVNTGYQEAEQRDNNPNSATYNQLQWVSNGYNTTACPLPAPPCGLTGNSGFSLVTSNFSSSAGVVSFYMVFSPTSIMNVGSSYLVATVSGGCKPSAIRSITYVTGGRTWQINIYPTGEVYWYLSSGTAVPANTTIGTSTLTYNL